jgi:hypothetical protein
MYIVSLILQSAINLTIDNQCTNIELTSPVYFIKDTTCHVQFPQKVNSKSIMMANFINNVDRDEFGGILLYCLQQKENTNIQLLVLWGYESNWPYSYTFLIEHESTFVWDKDKLKRLYDVHNRQYNVLRDIIWLLNDNIKLKTSCLALCSGFEMKITISEKTSISSPRESQQNDLFDILYLLNRPTPRYTPLRFDSNK